MQEICCINNQLLNTLGVGHHKIDRIRALLTRYGISAKITGAGGGGCVFAFVKHGTNAVTKRRLGSVHTTDISQTVLKMIETELQALDCDLWQPQLGGVGIVQHSTDQH